MKWYVLENSENFNLPEWARTLGIDEDGIIYIPAAITQLPEEDVRQHLEQIGGDTPMMQYDSHLYLPATWMSKEYPQVADLCSLFEIQANKVSA